VLHTLGNDIGTLTPASISLYTHYTHMSLSAIRGVAQNSAYAAQNSTKVARNSGVIFSLKAVSGKLT